MFIYPTHQHLFYPTSFTFSDGRDDGTIPFFWGWIGSVDSIASWRAWEGTKWQHSFSFGQFKWHCKEARYYLLQNPLRINWRWLRRTIATCLEESLQRRSNRPNRSEQGVYNSEGRKLSYCNTVIHAFTTSTSLPIVTEHGRYPEVTYKGSNTNTKLSFPQSNTEVLDWRYSTPSFPKTKKESECTPCNTRSSQGTKINVYSVVSARYHYSNPFSVLFWVYSRRYPKLLCPCSLARMSAI